MNKEKEVIEISNEASAILEEFGLDFTIEKQHGAYLKGGHSQNEDGVITLDEGSLVMASPYFKLVNSKTGAVINSVKEGYTVSQNDEIIEMVLRGIAPFGSRLSVHKAGSLNGGRKVFVQLAIEGEGRVGNDVLKRFVTIIDSNDGSSSLSVGVGNITMSCTNQFYAFAKSGMKFRHTASIEEKIRQLPEAITSALSEDVALIGLFGKFQATDCSRDLIHTVVQELIGINRTASQAVLSETSTRKLNTMDALYDAIHGEMNSKGENLWGLFSGITYWTTHTKSSPNRENGRIESLLLNGGGYKTSQQGLRLITRLMNEGGNLN